MRHAITHRSDGKEEEGVSMQLTAEAVAILQVQFQKMQAKLDDMKAENVEIKAKNDEIKAENVEIKAKNDEIKAKNVEIKSVNLEIKAELETLKNVMEISKGGSSELCTMVFTGLRPHNPLSLVPQHSPEEYNHRKVNALNSGDACLMNAIVSSVGVETTAVFGHDDVVGKFYLSCQNCPFGAKPSFDSHVCAFRDYNNYYEDDEYVIDYVAFFSSLFIGKVSV